MNSSQVFHDVESRIVDEFAAQVIIGNYGVWHCSGCVRELDDQELVSVLGG